MTIIQHASTSLLFIAVCVSVLTRFENTLSKDEKSNKDAIEKQFKKFCKDLKLKENRFCYFLGGTADAATGILGEMSKPMSWGVPADKVCEKLKKKDKQICELRYGKYFLIDDFIISYKISKTKYTMIVLFLFTEKQIDLKTIDLKKLKVRDLKKILNDWDETCDGCLEKGDFIKRIEELKPKHIREEL